MIIAGLINRRGLRNPKGTFNLNRWQMPVSVVALVWLAIAIVALTLPAPGHNAFYVFVGVVVLGVLWYFAVGAAAARRAGGGGRRGPPGRQHR